MKKTLIAFAACAVAASSLNAFAADGTINFEGEVSNQTCSIEGSAGATNKTVVMNRVAATSMRAAGQTAGLKDFTMSLTGCTGSRALVRFEPGSTVDVATGNLKNQATTDASNVQIQLLNANQQQINLQTNDGSLETAITDQVATLKFYTQYVAVGAAATAGAVKSSVQFSMDYF